MVIEPKHLINIADHDRQFYDEVLETATAFSKQMETESIKCNVLRGKSVINLFFENSTRTRTSFELAGKLMSADVVNFSSSTSSLKKGESLRDTVVTVAAMGFDAIVIRHKSPGVPYQATQWCDASIVNAGDGANQHPTQALLDLLTVMRQLKVNNVEGMKLALIGDIAHSRVVRSVTQLFRMYGAQISFVAPATLLPPQPLQLADSCYSDLDEAIGEFDLIYTIRPQAERINEALLPSMAEYVARYSIDHKRVSKMKKDAFILEAGPLIRGIQMSDEVANGPRNLMNKQVASGVAIRAAVLKKLLESK